MNRVIRCGLVALAAAALLGGCGPSEKEKAPNPELGPPPTIPPGRTEGGPPAPGGKAPPGGQPGQAPR